YNTTIPLPTVARDAPEFMKDTWRGPMWVNTAYLVLEGLKRQGQDRIAGELAFRICKGIFETWRNEGSFYEFYDPDRYDLKELTRKKGNLYKQITLGGKPVKKFAGWTALANAMLVEDVIGLNCIDSKWTLEPHIPDEWLGKNNMIAMKLPFYRMDLEIKGSGNGQTMECTASVADAKKSFAVTNHERVVIQDS
nr:hypothetical protein [Candidatus Sigynarchaeota archaeon]